MSERNGCMKRYVALLRGINISGKNKIAMSELKAGFAELGYTAVSTYLNSGNVVFCADIDDKERLSNEIRSMINKRFGLDIPVFVVSQEELEDILKNAPEWWGDNQMGSQSYAENRGCQPSGHGTFRGGKSPHIPRKFSAIQCHTTRKTEPHGRKIRTWFTLHQG